jgi:hypothetical protein
VNWTDRVRAAAKQNKGVRLSADEVVEVAAIADLDYGPPVVDPGDIVAPKRLPWLEEDNTINVTTLFLWARSDIRYREHEQATHDLALDQIRDVKARWLEATAPDANGNPKDPTRYFELYAGRTSLEDIKRIVEWT